MRNEEQGTLNQEQGTLNEEHGTLNSVAGIQHFSFSIQRSLSAWWPLLRILGLALPPYLALQSGLVSARAMGLAELDWIQRFGQGLAVSGALVLLLLAASWQFRHVNAADPAPSPWRLLLPLEAAAAQLMWALLRVAGAWFLRDRGMGALEAAYAGAWLGLILLYVAWAVDPAWRARLRHPASQRRELVAIALALATTVVFIVSGNVWLCWVLHMIVLAIV
jgi:hypothetical protein